MGGVAVQVCLHPGLMYDDYMPESPAELLRASGKLALLHNILPKLQVAGHRCATTVRCSHCEVHNSHLSSDPRVH